MKFKMHVNIEFDIVSDLNSYSDEIDTIEKACNYEKENTSIEELIDCANKYTVEITGERIMEE